MKINLNKSLKDLDGNEMPTENIGKVLAMCLSQQSKGDPVKLFGWAMKLQAGKDLEVDRSDFNYIKSFVENNEIMFIPAKAQILEILGNFTE